MTKTAFAGGSTLSESGWRRFSRGMRRPLHPMQERAARPSARRCGSEFELVAGVCVGGFIGWALDRFFGTAPFLMVAFLILGAVAGIMNVIRTAKAMQAKAPPAGKDLPAHMDDDDD